MFEVRVVVFCADRQLHWDRDSDAPGCTDATHAHVEFEVHRHLSAVELPGGAAVTAASFHSPDPYARDHDPDYGLYFDPAWQPPWPHDHVEWPDFGVPDRRALVVALDALLARAIAGEHVEIGCLGAHGRTGTAVACLAVAAGHPAGEAVAWAREHYCAGAVETPEQEQFVGLFGS